MPSTYCPGGHRINYSAAKPEKCPTCNCDLSPGAVAALLADPAAPIARSRQAWPQAGVVKAGVAERFHVEQTLESDDDMTFDTASLRVNATSRQNMTVAQAIKSDTPIERTQEASTPAGVEKVSVAALVQNMIMEGGGGGQRNKPAARKPRAARRGKVGGPA